MIMRTALTIAGSDSGGGAGIQADIKTMLANGVYAMSAITAMTAQNTTGVTAIMNATPEFLAQELECVFDDIPPDAVKIGMVSDRELICVISEKLKEYRASNIVVDPVMVATSGARLISGDAIDTLKEKLFPLADILTPNIPEAEELTGMKISSPDDMIAAAVSTAVYGAVSCWMYIIGMGAALFTGESDIALIMVKAGLGVLGLIIVIFSTVTTTFLDAYSAGISQESITPKVKGKYVAVVVAAIGTVAAMIFPMDDITDFLYLIGSVFAPMIAIQIADYFIIHRDRREITVDVRNSIIWIIGFILYRLFMKMDIPVGNTLPDMMITILLCIGANAVLKPKK